MKRISVHITSTYRELFKDLIAWGQYEETDMERDYSRIMSLIETRGESTIYLDFPKYGKAFDRAISRGILDPTAFPLLGKTKSGVPSFMNATFRKVFDEDGMLLPNASHGHVAAIRQVLYLYKKVQIPCTDEVIKKEVREFFSLDASLRPPSANWGDPTSFIEGCEALPYSLHDFSTQSDGKDPPLLGGCTTHLRVLIETAQAVFDEFTSGMDHFDPDTIVGHHGRGSVSDLKTGEDKYLFPTWSPMLSSIFPPEIHSAANLRLFDYGWYTEESNRQKTLKVQPAKLIPVNKTQEKPRLIASEPVANQFIQGGILRWMRPQMKWSFLETCVDIFDQGKSRVMAIEASKDQRWSTVDLSSASDRLSLWTVERAFRKAPSFLAGLAASRSPLIEDRKYTSTTTWMRKYAPQGNATVFPVQCTIYACLAIASVLWTSSAAIPSHNKRGFRAAVFQAARQVRVYGDDIIIPTHSLPALSYLLELCQLKINGGKSHYSGNFAESCGMDAFRGTDVTPVYLASVDDNVKTGDVQSAVDVSNACYRAGLLNLGNLVESRIPQKVSNRLLVTHHNFDSLSKSSGPSTNLVTYSSGIKPTKKRFSKTLHRDEYETLVIMPDNRHNIRDGWASLLQWYVERPMSDTDWCSGWIQGVRTRLVRRWVPVPA